LPIDSLAEIDGAVKIVAEQVQSLLHDLREQEMRVTE